jgi:asparagine synthase (glutamine-hydrolysing)
MCGICGIYDSERDAHVQKETLSGMVDTIKHRGPDDEGYYVQDNLGLGHRRLSIIDLSPAGHQPMSNEDGSVWIVFNGELYNYLELRPDLEKRGHRFRSRSDTEVIIHAYEEHGEDCLALFNGMFAFALWDNSQQRLFAARDRFGIKPFYYYWNGRHFVFASEIKAVLAAVPAAREADYPYLCRFLEIGLLSDGERTFFRDIKALPPAHYLMVGPSGFCVKRYWDFGQEKAQQEYDYSQPEETLLALIRDSVRLRLRSDVPVGTCLSGGLDSTAVVALASGMLSRSMHSFSSVHSQPGYDEGHFVEIAARTFDTNSHVIRPGPDGFLETLRKITWHMDGPTMGPGVYSQWFVMEAAHDHVKVILDGQGGDELFGGYFLYFPDYLRALLAKVWANADLALLLRLFGESFQILMETRRNFAHQDFWGQTIRTLRSRQRGERLLHPDLLSLYQREEVFEPQPQKLADALNNRLYWDITKTRIPALLHYEDRNGMAFSIETRVPLLDHRLVEFALALPSDMKIRGATTKYIMRRALGGILPPEIQQRKDKKGYPTPLAIWLREEELSEQVSDLFNSPNFKERGLYNFNELWRRWKLHLSGWQDLSWEIFRWLTAELWFQQFIDL